MVASREVLLLHPQALLRGGLEGVRADPGRDLGARLPPSQRLERVLERGVEGALQRGDLRRRVGVGARDGAEDVAAEGDGGGVEGALGAVDALGEPRRERPRALRDDVRDVVPGGGVPGGDADARYGRVRRGRAVAARVEDQFEVNTF